MRDIFEGLNTYPREATPETWIGIEKCKALARLIKARRMPARLSPQTFDIPPKLVSDALVDCYLHTSEAVYRVLHIPTFRRHYDALWDPNNSPDTAFLVHLKLVLAIGAVTYDNAFTLRSSAVRWVYEAQSWFLGPKYKSRLDIQSLQTKLLLLLAQERVGIDGDPTWVSIGALLRKATFIGLHRDPVHLPQRTVLAAEMRRRLWNTIIELALQSSLASGGPPYISIDDFDTAPPSNFDDDQLLADDPIPKPEDHFTGVSTAIELRKLFPQRLAVAKFLNDVKSCGTYEETLRLDSELRSAYRILGKNMKSFSTSKSSPSPSQFEIRLVDFIMHRYLSSLHAPYFVPAMHETAYAFSRKVVVESSLRIWRGACPHNDAVASEWNLSRLAVCSSGFFPIVATYSAMLIAVELRAQLREEESLGPVSLRPDLLSVMEESKMFALRCLEAGGTNVKGYLLVGVMATQVEGIMRGLGEKGIVGLIMKTIESVQDICLPILEKTAAALDQEQKSINGTQMIPLATPVEATEEWDFMVRMGYPSILQINHFSYFL